MAVLSQVSHSLGQPQTYSTTNDDPEFLIPLPLCPKCWGYRYELAYLVYMGLGMEPSV